jgi:hypothetical protein
MGLESKYHLPIRLEANQIGRSLQGSLAVECSVLASLTGDSPLIKATSGVFQLDIGVLDAAGGSMRDGHASVRGQLTIKSGAHFSHGPARCPA